MRTLTNIAIYLITFCLPLSPHAQIYYEISGSPFATDGAPVPQQVKTGGEKLILVDPNAHAWGAYARSGRLVRWGIATAGAASCRDRSGASCRTQIGTFRIYSLGNADCYSKKYPAPDGGAPMPYCMYFHGGQALHGSNEVEFDNASHGCVRIHVSDAKWLRYHFVEAPRFANQFKGTRVVIRQY